MPIAEKLKSKLKEIFNTLTGATEHTVHKEMEKEGWTFEVVAAACMGGAYAFTYIKTPEGVNTATSEDAAIRYRETYSRTQQKLGL